MSKKSNLNYLIRISLFGAIALILTFFEIASPIDFLKFDLSDLPALVGACVLGPLAGVIIEALKNILNLLIEGSVTISIGEWANFLIGSAFVVPVGLWYKKNKNIKGVIVGLVLGTLSMALVGALMNYYVLLPAYSQYLVMDTYTAVFKGITSFETLVLYGITPFNIVKGILVGTVFAVSYKFVVPPLEKIS